MLTAIGIPRAGVLRYESDLMADRWLLIARGTAADVEQARELIDRTAPVRVDVHAADSPPAIRANR
jgi:hypothetical protein